jgi:GH43 family beta-xylosidase
MYVLEASHPLGPYREVGKVYDPRHDTWAIDLTVFRHGGELYAVWSGWEESTDGSFQNLYIAPMANPWKISAERQQISRPEHGWEMSGGAVNEGPHVVRNEHAEKVFIVYAADASWTSAYKMGLLEWTGGDVMDPASWTKLPWPIFTGVGHGCFLDTPDGHWFVYHRKLTTDPGWADREIRWEPYSWDDEGYPVIGDIEEMHAKAKRPKARRDAPQGFPTAADATAKAPFRPHREPSRRVGGPAGEDVVVE